MRRGAEEKLEETQRSTDAYAHMDATLGHTLALSHVHRLIDAQTDMRTHRHVEIHGHIQ